MTEYNQRLHLEVDPGRPTVVLSWGERVGVLTFLTDDNNNPDVLHAHLGQVTALQRTLMAERLRYWADALDNSVAHPRLIIPNPLPESEWVHAADWTAADTRPFCHADEYAGHDGPCNGTPGTRRVSR